MDAEQTVSSEAEAAVAANNLDIEIEGSSPEGTGHEYDPESPLMDYNEDHPNNEDPIPALKKSNNGKEAVFLKDREIKK